MSKWAWACVVVVSMGSTARAGNDDEQLLGPDAAMMAGAVTATTDSGGALMYNPAGLAHVPEDSLDLSVSALTWRSSDAPGLLQSVDGQRRGAHFSEFLVVPTALAYVRPITDSVRVGLGLFQVRSSSFLMHSTLALDAGAQEWGLAVSVSQNEYDATVGLGVRVNDDFSLGVGTHLTVDTQEFSLQFSGARRPPGIDEPDVFAGTSAIGSGRIWGWRLNVGFQWQAHPRLRIGASVFTPAMLIRATQSSSSFAGVADTAIRDFEGGRVTESASGLEIVSAARARAGMTITLRRGWISLDGDYQHRIAAGEVVDARTDVWNLRVGGRLQVSDTVRIGAGVFSDRNSARRVTDFGEATLDFYGGTMGLHYDKTRSLADGEDSDAIHFESTIAVRYAMGTGRIGGLFVPDLAMGSMPESPAVRFRVHELALYLSSTLMF